MLSHFSTGHEEADRIQTLVDCLHETCKLQSTENEDDELNARNMKTLFLVEQLKLMFSQQKKYSCDTLLWAFKVFSSSSTAYNLIRSSMLTLPSMSYLRKLASVFNMECGVNTENSHQAYLRQKCQQMKPEERTVILMVDEIHVNSQISYKGGKLEGSAYNAAKAQATTTQVFMISSYRSKSKDIAAIIPVKNANAQVLHGLIVKVLHMLHVIGYLVICLISDNNRINRNAFTSLCGGNLSPCIPHPADQNEKLFILFDSVHLLKCIRNNWLAQSDQGLSFLFPSLHDGVLRKASFLFLRKLFSEEKSSVIKMAPALNNKCLFPTNTEKQNVNLALKVFDTRNALALKHFERHWGVDTSGTTEFIATIVKLWNVLNVKHPEKHIRLRNKDCQPIAAPSDDNMQFLQKVIMWLEAWQGLKQKPREGSLSKETMFALHHTLKGLVELCRYLLGVKGYKYILTGKFQTDNLEYRFSQYRRLSGTNYNISVQQVLEGEKKLKLMSVLKLVSSSKGTLTLKEIADTLEESQIANSICANDNFHQFLPFIEGCDSTTLSPEQCKVLVFISGYAASKVLPHVHCDACKADLVVSGRKLQVESSSADCFSYLSALDRGGLTWPSELVVTAVTAVFCVFQCIVGSKESEELFLKCGNQRAVVRELTLRHLSDTGFKWEICDVCGACSEDMLKRCFKHTTNIMLNNYTKQFCEKTTSANARKLNTFGYSV
jgi:hypothetical protein